MNILFKRIFAVIAIFIITFMPVLTPTVYAVESWSGDPWSGNPWTGDPWDGSDLEWSGDPWSGNETEGDSWTSEPWYLEGWNGDPYTGNPWLDQGWNGNPYAGNPWLNQGWNGNPYAGNPWLDQGWNGSPYAGNPWLNQGWNGNPYSGSPYAGNPYQGNPWQDQGFNGNPYLGNAWNNPYFQGNNTEFSAGSNGYEAPSRFYDSTGFKTAEYVLKDVVNGSVNWLNDGINYSVALDKGLNPPGYGAGRYFTDLLFNSFRIGYGDSGFFDAYDLTTKSLDGISAYNDFKAATNWSSLSNTAGNLRSYGDTITNAAGKMGALSKFNLATAAIGTVTSSFKTVDSFVDSYKTLQSDASGAEKTAAVAKSGENLGEFLMNSGAVASFIPGGQAVGAGMVAVGAGVWVVSKGVNIVAKNWDGIKSKAKKAGNAIKKGWNTVKGWFS
ncbi:hypothetical protein SAMN05216389_10981 [Oceanobacillus limi]|uniref:Uncharacterized protein n=1 Tax=Oceanobacillus limi TaxID=930131 RepID=A0A1I0DPE9_9BACI|nr:hypothetical protein [Oceanobacillus limi]SET34431.1 hypothetical protein SAMN05216389_10981 [Oceanobacillus limi]